LVIKTYKKNRSPPGITQSPAFSANEKHKKKQAIAGNYEIAGSCGNITSGKLRQLK
jgi:hypothetical protein